MQMVFAIVGFQMVGPAAYTEHRVLDPVGVPPHKRAAAGAALGVEVVFVVGQGVMPYDHVHRALFCGDKDIFDLKSRNERERDKIKELRDMYVSLYQKRFYEIGKYYDAASSHRLESIKEKAYHDVISSTQALFEEIASGSEGQKKFEARINADLDDIVSKIRSDFPKLKDDDIRFICYLIVGFDTSTISFLMDISKENVRVKKHRLREKLNGYSGPNETLYRLFA